MSPRVAMVVASFALGFPPTVASTANADAGVGDASVSDAARTDASLADAVVSDGAAALDGAQVFAPPDPDHVPAVTSRLLPGPRVTLGDAVTVTVTATTNHADDQMSIPLSIGFPPFEVMDRQTNESVAGERRTVEWTFSLVGFDLGEHTLPTLPIHVVTPEGRLGTVTVELPRVTVTSSLGNEPNATPRPPTAAVQVIVEDYTPAWIGGGILAALLIALMTWRIAKWWNARPKPLPPPAPPRPAWETALAKLTELRRVGPSWFEEGQGVRFVDGVSDTVREYLGARFGFDGLESTSDETIAALRKVHLPGAILPDVQALLGECDLIKFAKVQPTVEQSGAMLANAERLVRSTMPHVAPSTPEGPAYTGGAI